MSDPILDAAYNARDTVGPRRFAELMRRYRTESDAVVANLTGVPAVLYDRDSDERLDVWGPGTPTSRRPVFVFVHGGYWRALSRYDSAFMAAALDARGVATVVVDYTLAPAATLEEITRQVRAAIAWVYRSGPAYGLDPRRIVVGGSSAGGHLAAMTMVDGWREEFGLPDDVPAAGLVVSGLFDIRPLVRTHVNEWLGLDAARAAALSPILAPVGRCPAAVVVAEHEAAGFHAQSREFAAHWGVEPTVVPGRNHFDVVLDLADPASPISRALSRLIDAL
ncbi:alpha/beta hydrolase [Embleya sp. MST-111070]|uniref:alpha/beta hydrolase n=1 Tax=Embleya sp. MST-111070 TaxID=3398231 RepID=UPI003F73B7FB